MFLFAKIDYTSDRFVPWAYGLPAGLVAVWPWNKAMADALAQAGPMQFQPSEWVKLY